jgi:plastocyanin
LTVVTMRIHCLLVSAAALAALAACGGSSVGNQNLFDYTPKPPGNFAFQTTPSPGRAALGSVGAGPSQAPVQRPSPVQQQAAQFHVKILSDLASTAGGFDPLQFRVTKGTIIVFTNTDSAKAHSVVSESGPASFNSGLIQPGASWSYTASVTGSYSFGDGTRPYVSSGSFTVS